MTQREKVIKGLECCVCDDTSACERCGYIDDGCLENLYTFKTAIICDALELLKAQNEIIDDLIKVGYPHNFQREEPWIVNYMYAITDVIRKAVNLRNDQQ